MRKMIIGLAVLPLAACSDGVTFNLTSTMEAQTRGVAMSTWDDQGIAGMLDQTCAFDIAEGRVIGDIVDLPGSDDTVRDGDGESALVTSNGEVWQASTWGEVWSVNTPGRALDAAFTMDGVATLTGSSEGCSVYFADWSDDSVALDGVDCLNASLESSRSSEFTFVADGQRVLRVDHTAAVEIERGADLLSWDDASSVLVIANSGAGDVRGLDASGNTEWTVAVDGTVTSIDALGWEGLTLVSFVHPDGTAEVVVLNSGSGDVHADVEVPAEVEVTASPDGMTVALDDGSAVHFYDVEPSTAVLGTPSVQPQSQPTFGD